MATSKTDWEVNKELALRITADFFKLRELDDAVNKPHILDTILHNARIDAAGDTIAVLHAMSLQHTIIAARLRLNLEAYRVMVEIAGDKS